MSKVSLPASHITNITPTPLAHRWLARARHSPKLVWTEVLWLRCSIGRTGDMAHSSYSSPNRFS